MPVALMRAIRFVPGAVLRFTPALGANALGLVRDAGLRAREACDAVKGASLSVEHVDEAACRIRVTAGEEAPERWRGAQLDVALRRSAEQDYTLRIAWTPVCGGEPRSLELAGVAPMLGAPSEVYFAQRAGGESRIWLKLVYDAANTAAEVQVLTAAFAERLPATARALLPGKLALGVLRGARLG